ncbi:MAG: GNAT family protein [Planctomycetota bacterium]|nr:GNAT family protein [Planctomycetota bacterium]
MTEPRLEVPPDAVALGERVYLRYPVAEDESAFVELVSASREHLARWVIDLEALDDHEGRRWFRGLLDANAMGVNRKLFVHRCADGALLGCMNLNEIVRGAFQNAFLGYWIGAPYVKQGYMREALEAVLRYAFEGEALHRVEANIQPENAPSRALVRSAGFRREGFSPRYLKIGGVWHDHERWALTVEDWQERV